MIIKADMNTWINQFSIITSRSRHVIKTKPINKECSYIITQRNHHQKCQIDMRSWTLHALFWSSNQRKCQEIIFNCLKDPNILNSTSYCQSNLGPVFPKFVSKLPTTWERTVNFGMDFHILQSYILRRHYRHLSRATCDVSEIILGLYQDMSHVHSHHRPVLQVPTFVCFILQKGFLSAQSGLGFAHPI